MMEQPPRPASVATGDWSPAIYPPPPEYYEQRAQAAAAAAAAQPAAPLNREGRLLQRAAGRRGWLSRWRVKAAFAMRTQQPITFVDVMWMTLSGVVSFVVYKQILGWPVALGLILLILLHEMGHFVLCRLKGVPARLPIFIPGMGAFVLMSGFASSARDDAEIAMAGPIAGGLGSVLCLIVYYVLSGILHMGNGALDLHTLGLWILPQIAFINAAINLLNLVPMLPFDGGRATRIVSKWLLLPGVIFIALLCVVARAYLVAIVALIGLIGLVNRPSNKELARLYTRKDRRYVTLLYFGTAVGLVVTTLFATFIPHLIWMLFFGPHY